MYNDGNFVVDISHITATTNFLLAPAPLLRHVWQGQGWPSERWRPRPWCWDVVVSVLCRHSRAVHTWSHVGSGHHGLVHTCEAMGWSTHGHVWPGQRGQDTHWASPCAAPTWLLASHVTRVPDCARDNDQCYSLTRVTSAEHARYTRNNRPTQMDSSSTGWFLWHCFSFWVSKWIERFAFDFSSGKRFCVQEKRKVLVSSYCDMRHFCTHWVFGLEYLVNRRGSGVAYYMDITKYDEKI